MINAAVAYNYDHHSNDNRDHDIRVFNNYCIDEDDDNDKKSIIRPLFYLYEVSVQ